MPALHPDLHAAASIPRPVVTRFAPSPTGYLHLGHVVNAMYVWGLARALGGSVVVRIEDHDRVRSRRAFESSILDDLVWLGFIGARETGRAGVMRQSERTELYEDALRRLRQARRVYACGCSRTEIGGGRYAGRCRTRRLAEGPGLGLRVVLEPGEETFDDLLLGRAAQNPADQCGDLLIRDRQGQWTYHFAVTVDDLHQRVTLIVRGADLVASTGRQRRLARMLQDAGVCPQAPLPLYAHHPLVLGADGAKLSKSTGAAGVRELRRRGVAPAEVLGRAAAAIGLVPLARGVSAEDVASLVTGAGLSPDEYAGSRDIAPPQ